MSAYRQPLLAKVHIAKKQLGLDDDSYRAILLRVTDKTSSADCDTSALTALVREFKRLGFQDGGRVSDKPWVRKVYAIWADLRPLLDDADTGTLNAFVQRQTRTARNPAGISRAEWLSPEDATPVVQGLEGWLRRERLKRDRILKETKLGEAL